MHNKDPQQGKSNTANRNRNLAFKSAGLAVIMAISCVIFLDKQRLFPETNSETTPITKATIAAPQPLTENPQQAIKPKNKTGYYIAPVLDMPKDRIYGILDFDPQSVYDDTFEAAMFGDATSQYMLGLILDYCGMAPRSMEQIIGPETDDEALLAARSDATLIYEQCKKLRLDYPDLRAASESWFETAAYEGSSLALAKKADHSTMTAEESSALVMAGLKEAKGNQLLEAEAFQNAYAHISHYEEWRSEEQIAWFLLGCIRSIPCMEDVVFEGLQTYITSNVMDGGIKMANFYQTAIEEGRWDDLELGHNLPE